MKKAVRVIAAAVIVTLLAVLISTAYSHLFSAWQTDGRNAMFLYVLFLAYLVLEWIAWKLLDRPWVLVASAYKVRQLIRQKYWASQPAGAEEVEKSNMERQQQFLNELQRSAWLEQRSCGSGERASPGSLKVPR